MIRRKWVAYGLDIPFDYVIVETEGVSIRDSHIRAVHLFQDNDIDFDTVEPFDEVFIKRTGLLN